ncbi:hypothetical protein C8T65DRAFT_827829 [Cerioporus squamosus]|nr:hypothetical protein C8T65DRAFT_827829 [Cerioporus squamosus]
MMLNNNFVALAGFVLIACAGAQGQSLPLSPVSGLPDPSAVISNVIVPSAIPSGVPTGTLSALPSGVTSAVPNVNAPTSALPVSLASGITSSVAGAIPTDASSAHRNGYIDIYRNADTSEDDNDGRTTGIPAVPTAPSTSTDILFTMGLPTSLPMFEASLPASVPTLPATGPSLPASEPSIPASSPSPSPSPEVSNDEDPADDDDTDDEGDDDWNDDGDNYDDDEGKDESPSKRAMGLFARLFAADTERHPHGPSHADVRQ